MAKVSDIKLAHGIIIDLIARERTIACNRRRHHHHHSEKYFAMKSDAIGNINAAARFEGLSQDNRIVLKTTLQEEHALIASAILKNIYASQDIMYNKENVRPIGMFDWWIFNLNRGIDSEIIRCTNSATPTLAIGSQELKKLQAHDVPTWISTLEDGLVTKYQLETFMGCPVSTKTYKKDPRTPQTIYTLDDIRTLLEKLLTMVHTM
jgi:hypothetical protein